MWLIWIIWNIDSKKKLILNWHLKVLKFFLKNNLVLERPATWSPSLYIDRRIPGSAVNLTQYFLFGNLRSGPFTFQLPWPGPYKNTVAANATILPETSPRFSHATSWKVLKILVILKILKKNPENPDFSVFSGQLFFILISHLFS